MKHFAIGLAVAAVLVVFGATPQIAPAAVIAPGFDLLHTPDGGGILPGTMFGLTDDVLMRGNPIGPGNTDTIVERLTGLGDGQIGTIDVEIIELSLVSVDPIDLGGGNFFDVFVTLDPDNKSTGEIDVLTHDANGGTFESWFNVFVQVDLFFAGTDDQWGESQFVEDFLGAAGPNQWSHTKPADYPENDDFPSGGFYPGVVLHTGPHPNTEPASPEPSALIIWSLLGTLAITVGWWRRRRLSGT